MARNIIEEYLVSLGFNVDTNAAKQAEKVVDNIEKKLLDFDKAFKKIVEGINANPIVEKVKKKVTETIEFITTRLSAFFATTLGLLTAGIAAAAVALGVIAAATYKFMASIAKADLQTQLFARSLFTTVENARSLKAVMDSMGVSSLEDLNAIAMNPELRAQFLELRKLSAGLQIGKDDRKGLQNIRMVEYEFQKLNLIMNYFFQTLGGQLGQALAGPLKGLQEFIAGINSFIAGNMKELTHDLAGIVGIFGKLIEMLFRVVDILTGLHFTSMLNPLLKGLGSVLDLINSILDGVNKVLGGIQDTKNASSVDGVLANIGKAGTEKDFYKTGQDSVKVLAGWLQRIYEILSQAWNFIGSRLRSIGNAFSHPIQTAQHAVETVVSAANNAIFPKAEASMSPASGSLPWRTRDKSSPVINGFLQRLHAPPGFSVSAGMTNSGHSSHGSGHAFDIGLGGKSVPQIAALARAILSTSGVRKLDLEIASLGKYNQVIKALKNDHVDTSKVVRQFSKYTSGDNAHTALQPSNTVIHIHTNDPHKAAMAVKNELDKRDQRRARNTRGPVY